MKKERVVVEYADTLGELQALGIKWNHDHAWMHYFGKTENVPEHLQEFIEGYAKFARLPEPRKEKVPWSDLLAFVDDSDPIKLVTPLPSQPGYFDRSQLEQLLVNLVKNAVEASGPESDVEISIRQIQGKGVLLEVMDRGRGMDDETIQKAVLPFYSTKNTGSGLGLAISRGIIEAHGGRIWVESSVGQGSTFSVTLPVSPT